MIRLWVRFLSGTQKVFLREQLESVHIKKNFIAKLISFTINRFIVIVLRQTREIKTLFNLKDKTPTGHMWFIPGNAYVENRTLEKL